MAPEMFKMEELVFPHDVPKQVSKEPHFQRVWQRYREHTLKLRVKALELDGEVDEADVNAFYNFIDLTGVPSWNLYIYHKLGQLGHLTQDPGYQATVKVLEKLGVDHITIDTNSAEPYEEQFWKQYDFIMGLSEEGLRLEYKLFVTNPNDQVKFEAAINEVQAKIDSQDQSKISA